jgi:beta-fructofuranosidase
MLSLPDAWIWDSWIADDGDRYHLFFLRAPRALGDPGLRQWTGSVVRGDDGLWRMYYTGLSSVPGRGVKDQRIGLAESADLMSWRRVGDRPLLAPDPRWYRTLHDDRALSETWRDPFVYRDADGWHMLITARDKDAPRL